MPAETQSTPDGDLPPKVAEECEIGPDFLTRDAVAISITDSFGARLVQNLTLLASEEDLRRRIGAMLT